MAHLVEIKANTYVVNLPTFEEGQLAKRRKKRTKDTKDTQVSKKTKTAKDTQASENIQAPEVGKETQVEEIKPAAEIDEAVSTAPPDGKIVTLKDTRISYDDDTRLYTVEYKDEFYDDSSDLVRITRLVRELVPEATDKELNTLKEL